MIILILIGVLILFFVFRRLFKIPKMGNMILITGGIKTGKSMLGVHLTLRLYKKQHRKWKIKCFLIKLFKRLKFKKYIEKQLPEEPLIYSNIPLAVPYVPLTDAIIRRQVRVNYNSVFYICEASLVADSMTFKDALLNEQMLLFNKLFAHETKGGYLIYDTQSISDNHYAVKRCLSTYLYIHHTIKLPFFCVMYVRELKYDEDGQNMNTFESDVEDSLKRIIVSKRVWKKYDCYCYSVLTDDLEKASEVVETDSLKADNIISFKKYKTLLRSDKKDAD